MTIYGLNMDGLGTDSRQSQIRRALFGALYGLLGGLTFVLVAAFIDIWLHPDLPFGLNWQAFLLRLPAITLGLALVGAVTCWWHEAWQGLLSGAAMAAALTLITALISSQVNTGMKFIVLVFILMPVAVMTLPVAYFLRWVVERHGRALHFNSRNTYIAGLVLLVIAVGAVCGYFMKTSGRGVQATRFIHEYLQSLSAEKNPLAAVAGVPERTQTPYLMYATNSATNTEGFDIHVEYEDGYKVLCTVILYPQRQPFLSRCQPEE